MTNLPRAFGYVRVSDASQIDGHSLEAQERAIRDHCAGRFDLVRIYRDAGISAHSDKIAKRPAFKEMLEAVTRREVDLVIVHTFDRWARNLVVGISALKTVGEAGVAFVSLSENIDYSTPTGKLTLAMLSGISEFYSDNLGVHARKAKTEMFTKKRPLGQVPFGYRNLKRLAVLVPAEAKALRELVFEPFLSGRYDYKNLAQRMSEAGCHTRSLNKIAEQKAAILAELRAKGMGEKEAKAIAEAEAKGGLWHADTVRYALQNPFYAGYISYSRTGDRVKADHTPILTEEEYEKIQAIIAERRETQRPFPSQVQRRPDKFRDYQMRGMLRCSICGTPLAGNTRTADGQTYKYYVLYCQKEGATCPATGKRQTKAFEARKLEAQAEDIADALAALKDIDVEAMLRPADEVARAQREIASLEERKRLLLFAFELIELTAEEYAERVQDLNAEIRRLTPKADVALERAKRLLTTLREFPWVTATDEAKAGLLQDLFESLFVSPSGRIVAVTPRPEFRPFLSERAYVRRVPAGYTLLGNGDRDLEHPDEWEVQFVATREEADERIVAMERGTGLEPATTCLEGRSSTN